MWGDNFANSQTQLTLDTVDSLYLKHWKNWTPYQPLLSTFHKSNSFSSPYRTKPLEISDNSVTYLITGTLIVFKYFLRFVLITALTPLQILPFQESTVTAPISSFPWPCPANVILETIQSILKCTHSQYFQNKRISGDLRTAEQKATIFLSPWSNLEWNYWNY